MSNTVKITDYNSVENLNDTDILLINQNGENKKVTKEKLLEDVTTKIEGVTASLNENTQNIRKINTDLSLKSGVVTALNGATISAYNLNKSGKMVYVKLVISGLTTLEKIFANIPIGYRPLNYIRTLGPASGKNNARFEISTNGDVIINNATLETISTDNWFELNIMYMTGVE